jgi:hypothetical protein
MHLIRWLWKSAWRRALLVALVVGVCLSIGALTGDVTRGVTFAALALVVGPLWVAAYAERQSTKSNEERSAMR